MTGAPSTALSLKLGQSDSCCGTDPDNGEGCGKCLLVTALNGDVAINSDWSVIVMKKNICPDGNSACSG